MLRSLLTTTIRHFTRHQVFTSLSLGGLIIGISAFMLIFIWVLDELTQDRYHPDNEKVFMLLRDVQLLDGEHFIGESSPGPLVDYIRNAIPEVETVCQTGFGERLLLSTDKKISYADGTFAEASFFEVFNLTTLEGNPRNLFPDNQSVLLSAKLAKILFEDGSALGSTVMINNQFEAKVSGIYQLPENFSFSDTEFILPFALHEQQEISTWDDSNRNVYVKLHDANTSKAVEEKLTTEIHRAWESKGTRMFLFSLTDWQVYWSSVVLLQPTSRMVYIIAFGIAGIFILVMACINFINLSTARAAIRAREIGVRKMSGATRPILIRQFMIESFFITISAGLFSILVILLLLPAFNALAGKDLTLNLLDPRIAFGFLSIIILTGVLAGAYPAFLLSSLKPASILKGNLYSILSGSQLRRFLVIFQFSLSVILIFSAIVIHQQVDFLRSKDLGFDKENVLYVETGQHIELPFETFKNEALRNSDIESVAQAAATPMEINGKGQINWKLGGVTQTMNINNNPIDYDYLETLGFELLLGRNFSPERISDSTAVIITETAANLMGFENPIGQRVELDVNSEFEIIGVVKDFHNADIHDAVAPVFFYLGSEATWGHWKPVFIRYKPGTQLKVIDYLTSIGKKLSPNRPLEFRFVDQDFEYQFRRDLRIGYLSICFTTIAIIIACLGLFGLTLFNTQRRTKEIGVRKVLGASIPQVVIMLCKDFSKPIIIAIVLALPISYYLMDAYLNSYRYHTQMTTFYFVLTGFLLLTIALLTVAFQSIDAARKNPVEALKTD